MSPPFSPMSSGLVISSRSQVRKKKFAFYFKKINFFNKKYFGEFLYLILLPLHSLSLFLFFISQKIINLLLFFIFFFLAYLFINIQK